MSYTKQTWTNGETITDTKLNHMEDGIADSGGGGALVITATDYPEQQKIVLDKTWQEIQAVVTNGGTCYIKVINQYGGYDYSAVITVSQQGDDQYSVQDGGYVVYIASDPTGYPDSYYGD